MLLFYNIVYKIIFFQITAT